MQTGINIGVSKEAVTEAWKAILDILEMTENRADSITEQALDTLTSICNVNNTTISGCQIGMLDKDEEEVEMAEAP